MRAAVLMGVIGVLLALFRQWLMNKPYTFSQEERSGLAWEHTSNHPD